MTIPSGAVSLNDINVELGRSPGATITLNDSTVRALGAKYAPSGPSYFSGSINLNIFRGITYSYPGWTYGFRSGGYGPPAPTTDLAYRNEIDRWPFGTATPVAADVGNLTYRRAYVAGHSSLEYGYTSGGFYAFVSYSPSYWYHQNIIDRFPFASAGGDATDVADLSAQKMMHTGHSSKVYGYSCGGYYYLSPPAIYYNHVDRFPFASNSNASDIGNLAYYQIRMASGHSGPAYGYISGGDLSSPLTYYNYIQRFPIASGGSSSDTGDLSVSKARGAGQSSPTYGFTSGGISTPGAALSSIDRFPMAAGTNATGVGNLAYARYNATGASSASYGWTVGGSPGNWNIIDKFPIASGGNSADSGMDLSKFSYASAGHHW